MESSDIDIYGVRDGSAASLRSLAERRGPGVLAYCNQVCGPRAAPSAAAESFARMRAVLCDDENVAAIDADQLLRRATRHTAAAAVRTPQGPPPGGAITGRATATCLDVAIVLAASADGRLAPDQHQRLSDHIADCERCSALAEIARRAEAAYTDPVQDRIGTDNTNRFADAMSSIPHEGPALRAAPRPTETAPGPVALTGIFPFLPVLSDELSLGSTAARRAVVQDIAGARTRGRWFPRLRSRRDDSTADSVDPQLAA